MEEKYPKKRKTDKMSEESDEDFNKGKKRSKSKSKSKSRSKSKSKSKDKKKKNVKAKSQLTLESFGIKSNLENPSKKEYPKFPDDVNKKIKIVHWNVNGLRPLLRKKELDNLIKEEDPDFICFNETKIDYEVIEKLNLNNIFNKTYKSYWYCPNEKKGYSGTGILTKYEPISVQYGI